MSFLKKNSDTSCGEEEESACGTGYCPHCLEDSYRTGDRPLLRKNGVVTLFGSITDHSVTRIIEYLWSLNFAKEKDTPSEVTILINSFGGETSGGWALIDSIALSPVPVRTLVVGVAYSMAAYIFIAGDKRFMAPNSELMIHEFTTGFEGSYNELKDQAVANEIQQNRIIKHLIKYSQYKTKKEVEEYIYNPSKTLYMTPQQAYRLGLCDKILSSKKK